MTHLQLETRFGGQNYLYLYREGFGGSKGVIGPGSELGLGSKGRIKSATIIDGMSKKTDKHTNEGTQDSRANQRLVFYSFRTTTPWAGTQEELPLPCHPMETPPPPPIRTALVRPQEGAATRLRVQGNAARVPCGTRVGRGRGQRREAGGARGGARAEGRGAAASALESHRRRVRRRSTRRMLWRHSSATVVALLLRYNTVPVPVVGFCFSLCFTTPVFFCLNLSPPTCDALVSCSNFVTSHALHTLNARRVFCPNFCPDFIGCAGVLAPPAAIRVSAEGGRKAEQGGPQFVPRDPQEGKESIADHCARNYGVVPVPCLGLAFRRLSYFVLCLRLGLWWCGVVWCGVMWCGVVYCVVLWQYVIVVDMFFSSSKAQKQADVRYDFARNRLSIMLSVRACPLQHRCPF